MESLTLFSYVFTPMQELRERVLRGKYRIPFYMSTDCESLLKRFLVLNPAKRGTLEVSHSLLCSLCCGLIGWECTEYLAAVLMNNACTLCNMHALRMQRRA